MFIIISFIIIIFILILLIGKFKVHPFITLLLISIIIGKLGGLDNLIIVESIKTGFGNTLKSIGIIIAFGTIIGTYLNKNGGAFYISNLILNAIGKEKSSLAMNVTGFFVSIPVFCDSGFIILSPICQSLSKKIGSSISVLAVSLATGLYATHVFVPPTPGPLASASIFEADIGLVLIFGLLIGIPVSLSGWIWSITFCKRFNIVADFEKIDFNKNVNNFVILPILIPIFLIGLKSIIQNIITGQNESFITSYILFLGEPIISLMIGVFLSMLSTFDRPLNIQFEWFNNSLKTAGPILLIIGAGGSLGNILRDIGIEKIIGNNLENLNIGIFLPFIIAALIKSAQGSSTVSIITTSSIIAPFLETLGLNGEIGKVLGVLSVGAGAMTVSHVNDSYFWMVSQFSKMNTSIALKTLTLGTFIQGLVGIFIIFIISLILV
mgnify:CR=1 FL=1